MLLSLLVPLLDSILSHLLLPKTGYKIELTPEEQAYSLEGTSSIATSGTALPPTAAIAPADHNTVLPPRPGSGLGNPLVNTGASATGTTLAAPSAVAMNASQGVYTTSAQPPLASSAAPVAGNPVPVGANANANNAAQQQPQQSGQMQQAHAIHYVTKIRNRFSSEPETYRYVMSTTRDSHCHFSGVFAVAIAFVGCNPLFRHCSCLVLS